MTPPIATQKYAATAVLILSILTCYSVRAGEQEEQDVTMHTQPLVYNPEATGRLQKLFDETDDINYQEHSPIVAKLVKEDNADPNVNDITNSLLYEIVQHNDFPLTKLLLEHRADPNLPGRYQPICCR